MSAKFTPGPWIYDVRLMDHADHLNVWEQNGIGHIAAVSKGLTPDPSAEANTRLIASAPDLYSSLREVLDDWEAGFKASETPSFQRALSAYQSAAQ